MINITTKFVGFSIATILDWRIENTYNDFQELTTGSILLNTNLGFHGSWLKESWLFYTK